MRGEVVSVPERVVVTLRGSRVRRENEVMLVHRHENRRKRQCERTEECQKGHTVPRDPLESVIEHRGTR